jgi:CRISPR-associated protein Cas1
VKRHLNTLYVTTQGTYLSKEGATIVVRLDGEVRGQFPLHNLDGVVCFGQVSASPFLLGECAGRGVTVTFLTERGRFLARVEGPVRGNVLLRRAQYRRAESLEASAGVAGPIVAAKIANARTMLLRAARELPPSDSRNALREAASELRRLLLLAGSERDLDRLRGLEGGAARAYFGVFGELLRQQKEEFAFRERSRRPPLDPINALLSFVYTLLVHDCRSALEGVGLDPAVGFLHRDRPGRPSLALDLMEELRPVIADRVVVSLINLKQVSGRGFVKGETGAVEMDDETRKEVLVAYQKRKQEELMHPFLGEKTTIGMVPHLQALLLARHLRGDLDVYPAYFWR